MARLTTRELNVVTEAVYKRIDAKKVEFKLTLEYAKILAEAKSDTEYDELLTLIKDYEQLSEQINIITKQRKKLEITIKTISDANQTHSGYYHYITSVSALDVILNNRISKDVDKNFPTIKDIEAEIIMMSVSGTTDIVNKILEKYNLKD